VVVTSVEEEEIAGWDIDTTLAVLNGGGIEDAVSASHVSVVETATKVPL